MQQWSYDAIASAYRAARPVGEAGAHPGQPGREFAPILPCERMDVKENIKINFLTNPGCYAYCETI